MRTFQSGSIIIPMDTDYQDATMFSPYGLVYQLLGNGIPVYWSIKKGKATGDADFTATTEDYTSLSTVPDHGYRGGPFIIDSAQTVQASTIIDSWKLTHPVTIHRTTGTLEAPVARRLTSKPNIAVFADGNELICFRYLNAAGIPDSTGQSWPSATDTTGVYTGYPDVLDLSEVAGPTNINHNDGALFADTGVPSYSHVLVMHWLVWDDLDPEVELKNETVAEIRQFLNHSRHLVATCQSITAIENSVNGKFLTDGGLIAGTTVPGVDYYHADNPQCQTDGAFATVGGGVPTFSLAPGSSYYASAMVMMTESGTPVGTRDIWVTGYFNSASGMNYDDTICPDGPGRVSYLGGHQYSLALPISAHPDSQGTRLFLNSLFD